ncbi:MAG: flavodoxin family protein [Gammaproteobacteria bacterium]|nr:flavodoxin family protein [Gammaproteobacteria bacterium]MBQ0840139.1 flavodoxin family protein [Gammaproteobacteria bacterium]
MKHLIIIYHSQSGNTRRLAEAVIAGAREEEGLTVSIKTAFNARLEDLLSADGLLFGTPENFGYMSGALKDFFDRTYYPAEPHQLNLPYGVFISAGNDGSGAVREIERIARGYPLRLVADAVIAKGEVTQQHLQQCRELGLSMAAGLMMGIF